jgi:NCS1 family nucleobase:cation symporter-1
VFPNIPGFLKSAHLLTGEPTFFDAIYVYAWFIGFLIAGGFYYAGMLVLGVEQAGPPVSLTKDAGRSAQ